MYLPLCARKRSNIIRYHQCRITRGHCIGMVTTRSGFSTVSSSINPFPFFRLPAELRIEIYALAHAQSRSERVYVAPLAEGIKVSVQMKKIADGTQFTDRLVFDRKGLQHRRQQTVSPRSDSLRRPRVQPMFPQYADSSSSDLAPGRTQQCD